MIYRLLFLFVAEDRDALLLPDDGTPERYDARERYDAYYATSVCAGCRFGAVAAAPTTCYEQVKLLSGWLHDGGQPFARAPTPSAAPSGIPTRRHTSPTPDLATKHCSRRSASSRSSREAAAQSTSATSAPRSSAPSTNHCWSFTRDRSRGRHVRAVNRRGPSSARRPAATTPRRPHRVSARRALDPVLDEAAGGRRPRARHSRHHGCRSRLWFGALPRRGRQPYRQTPCGGANGRSGACASALRAALRDVVGHCIYGVDVNPMAVELCKVSLWMEALEPGRPLSFLDHRIVLGNACSARCLGSSKTGSRTTRFRPFAATTSVPSTQRTSRGSPSSGSETPTKGRVGAAP